MSHVPERFSALVAERDGDRVTTAVRQIGVADLPPGEVVIRVEYSSANYKDALALRSNGGVVREYPVVPGIDLAGIVVASETDAIPVGSSVVAHGGTIGTGKHGGYAEYARVGADEVVLLDGLSSREAMAIGTAGFTSALSVDVLRREGLEPEAGPVIVTAASGGVGMMAVAMLGALGYEVVASTGRAASEQLLRELGASRVIGRIPEDADEHIRPLGRSTWAGAVDSVGGRTLASILSTMRYGGVVAASGLTGGAELPTTVMPFILRAVTLRGIDSVMLEISRRRALWALLGAELRPRNLEIMSDEVAVAEVPAVLASLVEGSHVGRTIVRVAGGF